MAAETLSSAIVNDVIRGECGDPFAVLGPHVFRESRQSGVAIRAFLPQANHVTVIPADPAGAAGTLAPRGLFEARFFDRADPFAYQLEVRDGAGRAAAVRTCTVSFHAERLRPPPPRRGDPLPGL
jgi:hypothetical protein